jgi:hypothetical protein
MPVMGVSKFEGFFRTAVGVDVDRNDTQSYLRFSNDVFYDLPVRKVATRPRVQSAEKVIAKPVPEDDRPVGRDGLRAH